MRVATAANQGKGARVKQRLAYAGFNVGRNDITGRLSVYAGNYLALFDLSNKRSRHQHYYYSRAGLLRG
jgi:hypothetical protein